MSKNNPLTGKQKIVVIVGPTASGKSDLALRLARLAQGKLLKKMGIKGAEIVSADSRQVYRGMDIGTGKVTKKEQKRVRHYLIDVASPKKVFTADDFKKLGQKAITDIASRNKIPIIVGGTGFYIDVLLGRMTVAEVPPNKKLRKKLGNLEIEKLFAKLKKLDPKRAETIEPKNKRRLIRALEIVIFSKSSQQPLKLKLTSKNAIAQFVVNSKNILWIGLKPTDLKQRIKKRLDTRLKQGMIKEIANLQKQGLSWKRLDDFGLEYRWISRWLIKNGKIKMKNYNLKFKNSEEYTNLLRDVVRYSKRQITWFKRNKEIHWLAPSKVEGVKTPVKASGPRGFTGRKEAEKLAKKFLLA